MYTEDPALYFCNASLQVSLVLGLNPDFNNIYTGRLRDFTGFWSSTLVKKTELNQFIFFIPAII